jgi:hypothetical protein
VSDSGPDVTIVIGAGAGEASLAECLAALDAQRSRAQILVVETKESSKSLRQRFPWAEFHVRPGALVPELWRDGIGCARGRIVALTIAQMVPAQDWIEVIIRAHEEHDAVGGAIDPGAGLRAADWAEYFCRYARDMAPFEARDRQEVSGDNASYKRALLIEEWDHLRNGFWEATIHPALRQRGVGLWHTPVMLVRLGRSRGFWAFVRQRSEHGRRYPLQRGAHFTRVRHVLGVLGSPAVPFLMTGRVLREVFARRRYRAKVIAALPLVFALYAVWAFAEARGHFDILVKK